MSRRRARPVLLAAALAIVPLQSAAATCADEAVTDAARLHEFGTLMMDVSLRCGLMGITMQPHYEAMVSTHQAMFDNATARLKHFFATSAGSEDRHGGLYDRYATLIANRYGGGNTSLESCRMFDAVAYEIGHAADGGKVLNAVARAMITHPVLESAACPAQQKP